MSGLALYRVETGERAYFYLVVRDFDGGDLSKQLAAALGLKMSDPLPKPLRVERVPGSVVGRVKP